MTEYLRVILAQSGEDALVMSMREILMPNMDGFVSDPDAQDKIDAALDLRCAMARVLNEKQRQAVTMLMEGYTRKEIAAALDMNYDAARKLVQRAQERIRKFLKDYA